MKVLITGSEGFIGTHLSEALGAEDTGHEVIGLDWHPRLGMDPTHDLRIPGLFRSKLLRLHPDVVIHLAAKVGREFGERDHANTISSNALMTAEVALACGDVGTRLMYASSSEVYGDPGGEIVEEERGPFSLPQNLYGLTKRWGEEVCGLYAPNDLTIMRFSMPYGPGAPPGRGRRALDTFLWQAHHAHEITVHRDSERSWCWIGDTVAGIKLLLEEGHSGAFNIGRDDDPISMLDLAKMACDLNGRNYGLINLTAPPSHQTVVKRLSTEKLRNLGWKPTVDLAEGVPQVLDWVKQFDPGGRRVQ